MANRNAVAGVSEFDLNKITKELFHTLQPTGIFKLPNQRVEDIKRTISVSIDEEPIVDFQFEGLVQSKEVAIQRDRLVAYSALERITPDMPPAVDNWPAGAFIGADAAFLTAAGNAAIVQIQTPREIFNWEIFSGGAHVSCGNLSEVTIREGGVGDVDTTLSADAGASVTVKLGWPVPNFTLGARIGARINLTVQASVSNEQLYMDIRSVNLFDLEPDLSFIPDWLENFIDTLIDPLENELGRAVSNLIQGVLGGLKIPVLRLPSIRVPIANGTSCRIHLKDIRTIQLTPAGVSMLIAYGMPTIDSNT
ncbi:hypothetical protein AnigIFM63309_001579 [Aspergillus niger]|nr:hypothetical protein AnigIFM63309_001579 [Aspergillus niger]